MRAQANKKCRVIVAHREQGRRHLTAWSTDAHHRSTLARPLCVTCKTDTYFNDTKGRCGRAGRSSYLTTMKSVLAVTILAAAITSLSSPALAKGKQAQAVKEPDLCAVPAGAQPLLPAKLLPGMGITKDFPVTTTSEEARKFFLQGISQIHSFWFTESERSCMQALSTTRRWRWRTGASR